MDTQRTIIGLHSAFPQSGKSTIARALSEQFGARTYSIAGGIRTVAVERGLGLAAYATNEDKDQPCVGLKGLTPRQVLISIGNEFTSVFGMDYWIERLLRQIDLDGHRTVVIDDVRRSQEGLAIEAAGGNVFTISRDAARRVDDVTGWVPNIIINNNSELHLAVDAIAGMAGLVACPKLEAR